MVTKQKYSRDLEELNLQHSIMICGYPHSPISLVLGHRNIKNTLVYTISLFFVMMNTFQRLRRMMMKHVISNKLGLIMFAPLQMNCYFSRSENEVGSDKFGAEFEPIHQWRYLTNHSSVFYSLILN